VKVVGTRRMAREMALQMLYQHDLGEAPPPQLFTVFDRTPYLVEGDEWAWDKEEGAEDGEKPAKPKSPAKAPSKSRPRAKRPAVEGERRRREVEEAFTYACSLVEGAVGHAGEIDELIRQQADNWRLERMPAVDRNILRLAVFELLYEEDIPKLVVVDEAIELAKKFSTDQSGRFVNGLLDGLLKKHTFPGTMK
jgi:N utilization substance protein B